MGMCLRPKFTPILMGVSTTLRWPKKFLAPGDRVLILDDFLANGKAMKGLLDICRQAGASVAGIGICIEKGFQPGGAELRAAGYKLASLAIVDSMSDSGLTFREEG